MIVDTNLTVAALLLDLAEVYKPAPRYWGYKNASRSIRRHPEFLSELTDKQILAIPGVGAATLRIVRECLDTGASATVARIVSDSGKAKELEERQVITGSSHSGAPSRPHVQLARRSDRGLACCVHTRGRDRSRDRNRR